MGGWPDGVDSIKHSTTNNNGSRVNDYDRNREGEDNDKDDGVAKLIAKLIAKLKKKGKKLTNEEKVKVSLAILKRLQKGETVTSMKEEMCLTKSYVAIIYYSSKHPIAVNYRVKKECKRVQLSEEQQAAIFERVKMGAKLAEIAEAMYLNLHT